MASMTPEQVAAVFLGKSNTFAFWCKPLRLLTCLNLPLCVSSSTARRLVKPVRR